jgi:hypothetical protein
LRKFPLARLILPCAAVALLCLPAAARTLPDDDSSATASTAPVPTPDPAPLPDAPSTVLAAATAPALYSSSLPEGLPESPFAAFQHGEPQAPCNGCELDANGKPIPLDRQQPKRILGFMPNFRSVSAGAKPHPPGWKYNFTVATHQAFDYSSFIFLGLTTISAEGINSHPVLGKGADGFYAYLWRGFLDKTDGNYLGGWFLPSLLHEDTRFYPMGNGHAIVIRALYVMSRQVVTRTYSEHDTPNFAGLGGKVLAQLVSRTYYPTGATSFGVLATKFAYSAMRDIAFTSIREFYPDIAAHYVRVHREKAAAQAAKDARSTSVPAKP